MRLQDATLAVAVYASACVALVLGFSVVWRVTAARQYSTSRVPVDKAASDLLLRWDDMESDLQRRAQQDVPALGRDPMWPAYVARVALPANETPAAAAQERVAAGRGDPAPAPALVLPRLMGLLLDREARAVLRYEGKSRIVRPGDRFGGVQVVAVGREGVTVECKGARRLLRLR